MKHILEKLFEYQTLNKEEAFSVLKDIGDGKCNNSEITAFMTVFRMRPVTVEELSGFRDALLELCLRIDLAEFDPIDLCGTGGDGKDTFNISTLSSFVAAGAGVNVAKHGNYGVSSSCGSSNVMEHLGYNFTNDKDLLKKQIDTAGICFLHAPLFHPAMRHVGPVRRELGIKTFFNLLGPMVNPSNPNKQMVGVFSLELARLYNYIYQESGKQYVIIHALDGYDEISLTGAYKAISAKGESIMAPSDIGLNVLTPDRLSGGKNVKDAADIFIRVLKGECTEAQLEVVCANAGTAINCARPELQIEDSIQLARESIESGRAFQSFKKLLAA